MHGSVFIVDDSQNFPMVTISAKQMFEMITRMETVTTNLVNGLNTLKEVADDHEDRLRVVEARSDAEKRLEALETRLSMHDAAFTKQGERLGKLESWVESRVSPWLVSGVVAAIAAIVVDIILKTL